MTFPTRKMSKLSSLFYEKRWDTTELKYDFAAESFNMKDLWATEAALNSVMLAYNLMSLLRQALVKKSAVKHSSKFVQHTLHKLSRAS